MKSKNQIDLNLGQKSKVSVQALKIKTLLNSKKFSSKIPFFIKTYKRNVLKKTAFAEPMRY